MPTDIPHHQCAGVNPADWGREYPCTKYGTHEEAGKYWCGRHQPSKVKARKEKRDAKRKRKRNLEARRKLHESPRARIAAALKYLDDADHYEHCAMECSCNPCDCWVSKLRAILTG